MRDGYGTEVRSFYHRNPEVRRLVRRRRRGFVLKLLLLEGAVLLVASQVWRYGFPVQGTVFGAVMLLLLPLLLLKPFRTVGRGYAGEIVGTSEEMRRESSRNDPANVSALRMGVVRKFLNCTVACDDGKKRIFRVPALYGKVYRVGGRVLVVRGLGYPVPLDPKEHTVCLFCGARVLTAVDHCAGCGAARTEVGNRFAE